LAMNSGMETVSISTKSALPNSRLSCSAIVPALGFRWSQADSGGCARAGRGRSGGPAAGSGRGCEEGRARRSAGPGRTEAAAATPWGALGRRGSGRTHPAVSAPLAVATRRMGAGTPRRRRRRLVPPLALVWPSPASPRLAPPCPARVSPAPPHWGKARLSAAGPSLPHLGGAHARGGGARRAGCGGCAAAPPRDGLLDLGRRPLNVRWNQVSSFEDFCPCLLDVNKVTKVVFGEGYSLWFCHLAVTSTHSPVLTHYPSFKW
jgi:hypothetical protein